MSKLNPLSIDQLINHLTFDKIIVTSFLIVILTLIWKRISKKISIPKIVKKCYRQVKIPWLIHVEKVENTLHWSIYSERNLWYSANWNVDDKECFNQLTSGQFPENMNFNFIENGWTDINIDISQVITKNKNDNQSLMKLMIVLMNGEESCLCTNNKNEGLCPVQGLICIIWLNPLNITDINSIQKYLLLNDLTLVRLNTLENEANNCYKCLISQTDFIYLTSDQRILCKQSYQRCKHCQRKFDFTYINVLTPKHKIHGPNNNIISYLKLNNKLKDFNNNYVNN
ncbi:hypothetical protein O3M35_003450 [Rhynocoris fuscipes]|uniref:Uncharacterized protein n=1 Tax=Rhynocoris fuscipes TaxID=488301 RepID=A0AAW1CRL9_9HEMI